MTFAIACHLHDSHTFISHVTRPDPPMSNSGINNILLLWVSLALSWVLQKARDSGYGWGYLYCCKWANVM